MGIEIRKAKQSDVELLAWAMFESSRTNKAIGLFDLIFEPADDEQLLKKLRNLAQTDTKSYCHYSNFLVALEDGREVGVLCGYEPRITKNDTLSKALLELGIDESYKERIAPYNSCMLELDRQTWMLDFMEVKDDAHELSILKELVQKSLLSARLKGYRKVQTLVEIGSAEVQLTYKKLGFDVIDEKQSDEYFSTFGSLGIVRLGMHL